MAFVALCHNRAWSNKHNTAGIAPVCVAHVSSNMSVVKWAKEIAADIAKNVVTVTGAGDGKACPSSLTRRHRDLGALPISSEVHPNTGLTTGDSDRRGGGPNFPVGVLKASARLPCQAATVRLSGQFRGR